MNSHPSRSRRTAAIAGIAGAAVLGAVAVGTSAAAFADGAPTPSASATAGTPTAPAGDPKAGPGGPGAKHGPHIGGTVTAVSGSTVTVTDHDGFTRTVQLDADAAVTEDGEKAAGSAIVQGAHIEATGTVDADGTTLDADAVRIGDPKPGDRGPAGAGPRGPHGPAAGAPAAPAPGEAAPSGTPTAAPTPTAGS